MDCERVTSQLGRYVDGEMPPEEARPVEAHLRECRSCAAQWAALRELGDRLQGADPASAQTQVPEQIWPQIEARLDQASVRGRWRAFSELRRPLAAAASLALFIGLAAIVAVYVTHPPAAQASIDYSILLEGLHEDIEGAIQRFLNHYDARPIPAASAEAAAPSLSFKVPETLPGGYQLDRTYRLAFGPSPGVAAIYHRDDEILMTFFHPTADNARVSNYEEMPCIVGEHHGGEIEVGSWRLMHFMDETTCHCVLTILANDSELPEIVEIIAPDMKPGTPHHH